MTEKQTLRKLMNQISSTAAKRAAGLARNFSADRAGAVILLFGLTIIPMMGFIGGAIDYANAYRTRTKLQNALDAASLAAGRDLFTSGSESSARQAGMKVLEVNLGTDFPAGLAVNFNFTSSTVNATATVGVDTYILGVLGIEEFPVGATSDINIAGGTFEVALVLDNSGSMAGSKISNLRSASNKLVDILFAGQSSSDYITIGLAPFAASVNVGTQYATASWMDQTGASSIHAENFDASVTRWGMFNAISNTGWRGCVEVRPSPHDVTDTPPTGGDSMFVPLFAPDEPDKSGYYNNYLSDDGGSCSVSGGSNYTRQRRTCKYDGASANINITWTLKGPNHLCDSPPIQALTNSSGQIKTAIDDMEARGATNIMQGLMWGWRILSPNEPLAEGKPYGEPKNTKIIILMSDGRNWHGGLSNHNESWFSAFGYHAQDRLGSPSNSSSALRATMNTRTAQVCTNAKAADVVIYALALEITDQATKDMLETCASSPAKYFTLDNSNSLDDAFQAIAEEISNLRIAG